MVPSVTELASEETRAWLQPNSLISGAKNIPGVAIVPPKINARAANNTATISQACRSCLSIGATPRVRSPAGRSFNDCYFVRIERNAPDPLLSAV
jgi:hypothetical protein